MTPLPIGPVLWEKSTKPVPLVMNCALPPVLVPAKVTELPLVVMMVAFIAELESLKIVVPPNWFTMVAVPALFALKKFVKAKPLKEPSLVIEVMPAVLALMMSKRPSLVTAPMMLPVWANDPSCNVPQEQIVGPPG